MKRYFMAFLALIFFTASTSAVSAGSAQECRATLDSVLKQLNIQGVKPGQHFWTLTPTQITEFKTQAQAAGLWAQFATLCNSWTKEECQTCPCGADFSNTSCSPNCGCCWGNTHCSPS